MGIVVYFGSSILYVSWIISKGVDSHNRRYNFAPILCPGRFLQRKIYRNKILAILRIAQDPAKEKIGHNRGKQGIVVCPIRKDGRSY